MLNVFLDGGDFMKTVTDVNVHERLGLLTKCATKCFLKPIVHQVERRQAENWAAYKNWDSRFWESDAQGICFKESGVCRPQISQDMIRCDAFQKIDSAVSPWSGYLRA